MQRQHQVRSSTLPDGVAVPLPEEALRAVQDAFPLHQALPPPDARHRSYLGLSPPGRYTYLEHAGGDLTSAFGCLRLALLASLVNADRVEGSLLAG